MCGWFSRKKPPLVVNQPPSSVSTVPVIPALPHIASMFCNWATPSPYFFEQPDGTWLRAVSGTEAPHREPWKALRTTDREPAIGYYDERQPEVGKWYADNLREGKFSVACFQIGHAHEQTAKMPDWLPRLESSLLYKWGPDNHPLDSGVKFCLSNWDATIGTLEGPPYCKALRDDRNWTLDDIVNSTRIYARNAAEYMKRDDYWRQDGKPVFYRGWAHTLAWYKERYNFDITASEIVGFWREEIKSIVGVEPFLIATSMDPDSHKHLKEWGFSGFTQYLLHGKGWADAMGVYRYWWQRDLATCRAQGLKYIVPVTAGYNGEAWNTPEYQTGFTHIPTAAEFLAHVREARKLAFDNHDVCIAVGEYAGTEWGEGGIEMPMKPGILHDGDEMLRAHKAALT